MALKIFKKDVKGLEKSKLDPKIIASIFYARVEARKIKNKLEPNQINSWLDLREFLEKYAEEVREKARILKKRIEKGDIKCNLF